MRRASWIGSAALHGAAIVGLAWCARHRPVVVEAPAAVELLDWQPVVAQPAAALEPVAGAQTARATARPARSRGARVEKRRAKLVVVEEDRSGSGTGSGSGSGDGSGSGNGSGNGSGSGGGDGSGSGLVAPTVPAPPPPLVQRSRARPPRLLYPARERDERDGAVFVARLTIDRDGYVVAVHLEAGGARRDREQAESAVWRFRYEPALDDDGRPTVAHVEQRFMVE